MLDRLFHYNSIKKKLLVLMTCIGIFSVIAGAATSAWYSYKSTKENIQRKMEITTNIVGSMTDATLSFLDPEEAERILAAFRKEEEVQLACLYTADNELFAQYAARSNTSLAPTQCPGDGKSFQSVGGYTVKFQHYVYDATDVAIGNLIVLARMKTLESMLFSQLIANSIIVLVVSVLALGGAYLITPIITDPIQSLVDLTRRISEEKDYSLRASTSSSDEIGVLSSSFNHMLATIQERERELYEINEKVEAASRSKSEFLANMSHEIRTPINGILGFAQLLSVMELDEKQRGFVDIILSSGNALLTIINDILDFSKIEAGKLHIESVPFDLQKVIEEVVDIMTARAEEKGLEIALRLAPGTPTYVIGDPSRVRQVLTNYVGNSIKFTETGHVMVNAEARILGNTETIIRFEVIDTGIGISKDAQKKIFEKFIQADSTTTKRYGGTGLGLAISQQLAHLMGGEVGLVSEEGKGSTFWIEVPFRLDQSQQQPTNETPVDLTKCRMLVVDDHEVNRRILLELSEGWGIYAEAAESGEEALHLMKRAHSEGRPFHIGILDYQLPNMDGEDLSNLIKTDQDLADTRLILLTSMGMRGDAAKFQEIGFDAYLVKPARANVLLDTIATVWTQFKLHEKTEEIVTQHSFEEGGERRMRDEGSQQDREIQGTIVHGTSEEPPAVTPPAAPTPSPAPATPAAPAPTVQAPPPAAPQPPAPQSPQQPMAAPPEAPAAPTPTVAPSAAAPEAPVTAQQPTAAPLGPSLEDRMADIIEEDKQSAPSRGGLFASPPPERIVPAETPQQQPAAPQPAAPLVPPGATMPEAPPPTVATPTEQPPAPQETPPAQPETPASPPPEAPPAPAPQEIPVAPPQQQAAPVAPAPAPAAAPTSAPAPAAPTGVAKPAGEEKILLVEDQLTNRLVVENMLENFNMKTAHAENGQIAVEKVQAEEFDVILMDVQMPVMNGYDSTRAIRQFEQESGRKPCQIIAVTANAMQGDREKCLEAGMNDYIAKPIQAAELERMVKKYLAIAWGVPAE